MMKCPECGADLIVIRSRATVVSTRDCFDVYDEIDHIHLIRTSHKTDDREVEYEEHTCFSCGTTELPENVLEALYEYEYPL